MRTMTHIKVGDTVFVVERGDHYRQDSTDRPDGFRTVKRVGRDYFYTDEGWFEGRYSRDTGHGAGAFTRRRAYADEATYVAAKAREDRERLIERTISQSGRWHWERATDEDLDQLAAMAEKLRGSKVEP